MENNTSVIETISTVNRGSGLSNNLMAYRLALIMENHPPTPSPAPERDRLEVQDELRTTLAQKSQEIASYKQNLKNKYYQEYIAKFGVNEQSSVTQLQSNAPTRVENLVEERKQHYIQKFLNAGQRKVTRNQQPQNSPQPQKVAPEETKASLIPAALNTVMTKGKDTEQGRVYDGIIYRLQLLAKEGMQRINIIRKQGQPGIAFSAYKDDGNEFKVTEDNLSPEEKKRIITFDQQKNQRSQINEIDNKGIEFDD